jgi:IS4 transposase
MAANGRPVAVLLRPGKTPSGEEIRGHVRRMVRRIRRHWPHTRITLRGDCHYGRHEVMTWCEANGLHYIFGLSGNVALDPMVEPLADTVRAQRAEAQAKLVTLRRAQPPVDTERLRRAEAQANAVRRHTEIRYGAKHWRCQRRVAARIEATPKGLDIRYVVTNLVGGNAEWLYETLYCARGQMELFFKWIKQHLRIKRFYGTSENTQIWIAVSVYGLVAIVKKQLGLEASLYTLMQVISVTIFEKMAIRTALSSEMPQCDTAIGNRGKTVGTAASQAGRNRPLT